MPTRPLARSQPWLGVERTKGPLCLGPWWQHLQHFMAAYGEGSTSERTTTRFWVCHQWHLIWKSRRRDPNQSFQWEGVSTKLLWDGAISSHRGRGRPTESGRQSGTRTRSRTWMRWAAGLHGLDQLSLVQAWQPSRD